MIAEPFLERFWLGMAAHLWQSTAVLAVVFLLASRMRGASAGVRNALWLIALAKVMLPLPILGRVVAQWAPDLGAWLFPSGPSETGPGALAVFRVVLDPTSSSVVAGEGGSGPGVFGLITVLWSAGACFLLLRWIRETVRVGRRHGSPLEQSPREDRSRVAAALRGTGVAASQVLVCDDRRMPGVRGAFRPRILLPRELVRALTEDELRAVLIHEAAHCRRRDPLLAHLQRMAQASFFFHPLLWPVLRRLRETAELACDEQVIAAGVCPGVYGRALGRTLQLGLRPAPAGSALAVHRPSLLRRRLERLADAGRSPVMKRHRVALVLAAALVATLSFIPLTTPAGDAPAAPSPGSPAAGDAEKQQRSLADIRALATACEMYSLDNERYPGPTEGYVGVDWLASYLGPYVRVLPREDGWGHLYRYWSDGSSYALVSYGRDGIPDRDTAAGSRGTSGDFDADIVYRDGKLLQDAVPEPPVPAAAPAPPTAVTGVGAPAPAPPTARTASAAPAAEPAPPAPVTGVGTPAPAPPAARTASAAPAPGPAPRPPVAGVAATEPDVAPPVPAAEAAGTTGRTSQARPRPDAPEPPAAPKPTKPSVAGLDASEPKIIPESMVQPEYPEDARKAKVQGKVILQALIDREGRVAEVEVLRSVPEFPSLAEAAVEAVSQWRYEPAERNGKPVAVYFTIVVEFKLNGNDEHKVEGHDEDKVEGDPV
jgi:protein TonB